MRYWRDGKPADIIVDPDGSVWVSMEPLDECPWPSYVELEEIQSEDFDCARAARHGRPSYRRSARSGDEYYGNARGYPRKPESKYGIRDHRPMNPQYAEQARLWTEAMGFNMDPEVWRKWFQ